jgi:lipid-binding SYLF domain-containing protein
LRLKTLVTIAAVVAAAIFYSVLLGQNRSGAISPSEESARAENVATVFGEIMRALDETIPSALVKKASGIVIAHVRKGVSAGGSPYGKGLVAQRNADGSWATPLFIEIKGGSFGRHFDAEDADLIIIFTNRSGIVPILKGKLTIGPHASAAAGPIARTAEAGAVNPLSSSIYSYSRSKGLLAGITLSGVVVRLDDEANKSVYGKNSIGPNTGTPSADLTIVQPFLDALHKYAHGEAPRLNTRER